MKNDESWSDFESWAKSLIALRNAMAEGVQPEPTLKDRLQDILLFVKKLCLSIFLIAFLFAIFSPFLLVAGVEWAKVVALGSVVVILFFSIVFVFYLLVLALIGIWTGDFF